MNRLKPVFFRAFETQFSGASNDKTAVNNLCSILQKPIEKALIKKLQIEIVDAMKLESSHFRKKNYFKALLMKDLAATQTFSYLLIILAMLLVVFKIYVERHCRTRKDNGDTNLYNLAELNLNVIIGKIVNAIKHLLTQFSNENPDINNITFGISDEDMDTSEDFIEHLEMNEWLEKLCDSVKKTIAVDLQEITDIVGVQNIHNPNFFLLKA